VVAPSCLDQALHDPADGVVHVRMVAAAVAEDDDEKVELGLVDNLRPLSWVLLLVHHDVVVVLAGVEEEAVEAEE
jgi:hypothetical protein